MMNNNRVLQLLKSAASESISDDDEEDVSNIKERGFVENSPRCSPIHISSGFISPYIKNLPSNSSNHHDEKREDHDISALSAAEGITVVPGGDGENENIEASPVSSLSPNTNAYASFNDGPINSTPPSPLPPMSPETEKICNILYSPTFMDETEVSDVTSRPTSLVLVPIKMQCESIPNTKTSPAAAATADKLLGCAENADEKVNDSPALLFHTPKLMRTNIKENVTAEKSPLSADSKLDDDDDNAAADDGCQYHTLTEKPGESSIEAPPFSPLTPRPSCFSCTDNKQSSTSLLTTALTSSLRLVHDLDDDEQKKDDQDTEIDVATDCNFECDNNSKDSASLINPQEESQQSLFTLQEQHGKYIDDAAISPILRGTSEIAEKLPQFKELPGERSIEAPPFSPLTPRQISTRNSYNRHSVKNCNEKDDELSPESRRYSMRRGIIETTSLFELAELSDDSVRDPDYNINSENDNDSSSDESTKISSHVITTQANIHNPAEMETETISEPVIPHDTDNTSQEQIMGENSQSTSETYSGRPRKGRKRKYGGLTREERKKRKYENKSYVNSRKKNVGPKPFIDYTCVCSRKCHENVSVEKRLTEFKKFYALGTYISQNMFIGTCVKEEPVKRSYVSTNNTEVSKKKTYSRRYFLQGIQVCRDMFVKTLQTSPSRINTSLCKLRSEDLTDKRGLHGGMNRVAPERVQLLVDVINRLPKYTSHYRRNECNDAKFLRPDMTFNKIYKMYCDEAALAGLEVLSLATAKHIYLTKFNLRTKSLKKDKCNKCDYFHIKKKQVQEEDQLLRIEKEHSEHLAVASSLQNQLRADMDKAKSDPHTETLTYDLEKTLPLLRIPTNIVFYKRQLWVYNLGIHAGSNDQGHCNVWVEGEAGRGAQEVGSCLLKHALNRLTPEVQHLILWSDSCGGQNRNIKITLMLKALLNDHPTIKTISLRFLESGHSFLPNDTDFGSIECALKHQQRLYTPDDYMQIMTECRKIRPLKVHRMQKDDFKSSAKLEKQITNRKITVDKLKVSWLKTKEILLKKENMFSIFMRSDLEGEFVEVDIKKNGRGTRGTQGPVLLTTELMESLWPNGKPIPMAKLQDLKSLMHLIPREAQGFYKKLVESDNVVDDIDGFSGEPDFEMEYDISETI